MDIEQHLELTSGVECLSENVLWRESSRVNVSAEDCLVAWITCADSKM